VIFYRLSITPDPSDGEGTDCDQWFASLTAAKRFRASLIADNPELGDCIYEDYEIERVMLTRLSTPKQLLLAVLNRNGYVSKTEVMVEAYKPGAPEAQRRRRIPAWTVHPGERLP